MTNPAKATAEYAALRRQAAERLKARSVIAFSVERVFRTLQYASPASHLGKPFIDLYVLAWVVFAVALGAISYSNYPAMPRWLTGVVLLAAALRITDITQAVVNVGLFDHLGERSAEEQGVDNIVRSLVLLVWNFGELMIWFGLAYLPLAFLQDNKGFWTRLYFSGITQLTIGYGDLTPIGAAKALALVQGTLSWVVSVIIIARFVGALPRIRQLK